MLRVHVLYFVVLTTLLNLAATACRSVTPPAPDMAGGAYENAGYQFFHWQEGVNIMIWHDALSASTCDSQGATTNDAHLVQCRAQSENGAEIFWEIETKDGRTADIHINNQPFDLTAGTVFLIKTNNGTPDVEQLQRDLSGITPQDHESITQYSLADFDIGAFIQSTAPE